MQQLVEVSKVEDIFPEYRNTPIGLLLEYHNLNKPQEEYKNAELLIGMCMDNRKHLRIPDNFSYIIRSGGANLRYSEFKLSYAISVGGIKHIALVGHNDCGMVNLANRKTQFINGMVQNAGWSVDRATEHFEDYAPKFEIGNEIDFVTAEAQRLREVYPKVTVVPMLYKVEDGRMYLINEG